jgi:hypothetical protein
MFRFVRLTRLLILGLGIALGAWRIAAAGDLAPPTGPVILEVSGSISNTNGPGVARFDLAMLKALEAVVFETSTNWTDGKHKFEGPSGKALAAAVGATGTSAQAIALNDYKVEIPLSDFFEGRLILAHSMDGAVMSVRDKGPLWVLYDFDSDEALRTDRFMSRSIWQLRSIKFE